MAQEKSGYRVQRVEECEEFGGSFAVILSPIYHGKEEDGPQEGEALYPHPPKEKSA
jgi:hypothetical protein